MNLACHLARAGAVWPRRPAVARGSAIVLDYAGLAERAARLAGALRGSLGLETGDRVLLAMGNCTQYLEALYACWHAGLVAVPANAKLHADELSYVIEDSGARVCFVNDTCRGIAGTRAASLKAVVDVASAEYDVLLASAPIDVVPRDPGDSAWLFYTSGTTGRPKGADLSHRSLLAMSYGYFADVDPQSPWRALIHAAPMSHGSGLYIVPHVTQASCHIVPESGGFDPEEIYGLIECWPGASMFAAPTMVKRLVDHPSGRDTANLKSLIYGGGPMYVEDCLTALDRFGPKLTQLYGQGESPMTITALNAQLHADKDHPRWLERLASVGVAQSAVEIRIADADDASVPTGEIGEVLVRGDTVMKGYWRKPEATAETLRGGWLHTGDLGSLDADGFLTLRDRSKDVIISGGTNIYPREVEEVLLTHPSVGEVSVIGEPDREWGETVLAVVVRRQGASVTPQELDTLCLSRMARFKRPRRYEFVDSLPKNSVGKVLKIELRARLGSDLLKGGRPAR